MAFDAQGQLVRSKGRLINGPPLSRREKDGVRAQGKLLRKQRMANQWLTPIPRDHTSMYIKYTCRYLLWVGL
jgi:hypothetical protein